MVWHLAPRNRILSSRRLVVGGVACLAGAAGAWLMALQLTVGTRWAGTAERDAAILRLSADTDAAVRALHRGDMAAFEAICAPLVHDVTALDRQLEFPTRVSLESPRPTRRAFTRAALWYARAGCAAGSADELERAQWLFGAAQRQRGP